MEHRYSIAVTGHRPNKLFGYNLHDKRWINLGWLMRAFILSKHNEYSEKITCISGMALGADQLFALVALKLRDQGFDIKVVAALPCKNQNIWADDRYWRYIMKKADEKVYVSKGTYTPWCMQKRNEYMVDNSDILLAVWDGSPGGTANCIKYAKKVNKDVVNIYQESMKHGGGE